MTETTSTTTESQAPSDAGAPAAAEAAPAPTAPPVPSFAELGVRAEVLKALEDMGFAEPMKVQSTTLPLISAGKDLMVQSRTGSGKTAAFGIPFFNSQVNPEEKNVQAIVLLPTRELALQVAAELAKIGAHTQLTVVPVYGGAPMGRQVEQLRAGGQIVCGTPGRIMDHMRRGTLKLDKVKVAVLDECDEMLSMGFQEDIETILEGTPATRQTLLFSATVPEGIQRLSRRFMREPEFVKLSADFIGVNEIRHVYYSIPGADRENDLLRILQFESPRTAIVFCNTREETGRVAGFLRKNGFNAEAISSDLSQSDREKVMTSMRAGEIQFMVATDVAARGIDLESLSHVFNYTFPEAPEVYIHRTGRTGRAGKHGTAVSLIGPTEVGSFYYLKLLYKIRPEERALPSETEVRSKREGERVEVLRAALPDDPGAEWSALAKRLINATDGERLVASLLARSFASKDGLPPAPKPKPAPVAHVPHRERPERVEARDDRPRDGAGPGGPGGDRDRGGYGARGPRRDERGRPPRDDRGRPPREGDRDRGGPRSRPRRPEGGTTAGLPPTQTPAVTGGAPDKEFWEAWADEKAAKAKAAEGSAPEAAAPEAWGAAPPSAAENIPTPKPIHAAGPGPGSDSPPEGTVRLYLNLGRKDGASEAEIGKLLSESVGVGEVAAMDVMNTHTYINVAAADADRVTTALQGKEIAGRQVVCERARPKRR